MFTVEEICEEQERQYNKLMQEDDQYCHPESFKWGFEHGIEYALSKLGWHPADKDEPEPYETVVVYCETSLSGITSAKEACVNENHCWSEPDVQWWCYPPKED